MLSAAYSGIFQDTGLLDTARVGIARMSRRITPFGALLCTACLLYTSPSPRD